MTSAQAPDPEYVWVRRHTWQSWRERYKKNAARLDNIIAAKVEKKKPAQGEKGQYGYVRKPEDKSRRIRKKRSRITEQDSPMPELVYDEEYIGSRFDPNGEGMAMMQPMPLPPPRGGTIIPFPLVSALGGGPLDMSHGRRSPDEEEMDEADESAEWQVRVGNDAPPAWASERHLKG
jgi:hypothetical protein